jgi:hypothetical protein
MMIGAWWRIAAVGGQVELYASLTGVPIVEIVHEPPAPAVPVTVINVVPPAVQQKIIEEPAPAVNRTRRSMTRKPVVPAVKKKVVKRKKKNQFVKSRL